MTAERQHSSAETAQSALGVRFGGWAGMTVLFLAAAVVRFVIALRFGGAPPVIVDAIDYDRLATTLLEKGSYLAASGELTSLRPPFYPMFLAGLYWLFGVHNYLAVSLAQSLVSLCTMVLTYRLGRLVYDRRSAFIAAAILGFYPSLIAFNCFTLSEVLFTFFFTASVLGSVRLMEDGDWRVAALLGFSIGLGALTRSVLAPTALPVLAFVFFFAQRPFFQRLKLVGITFVVMALTIAPWSIRNTRVQKTFTLVDVMSGRNVMMGNYEYTPLERSWATVTDVTGDRSWDAVLDASLAKEGLPAGRTQGQYDKKAMAYGLKYLTSHPSQTALRCLVRFFNFWQLDRTVAAGMQQGIFGEFSRLSVLAAAAVFCGGYALLFLSGLAGFTLFPPPWRKTLLLSLWLALPCAFHTLAFAHSRYHKPLMPIVAMFSAVFWVNVLSGQVKSPRSRCLIAALLAIIFISAWVREIVFVDLHKLS